MNQELDIKIKQLFAYTHRGDEDNMKEIGIHARIPLKFRRKLTSNELFILSFIEIHHFMDKSAYTHGNKRKAMPIRMFSLVLGLSERLVKDTLKDLKVKGTIKEVPTVDNKQKSYVSNIMKKGVKYQMLTLKFLMQPVFSKITRDFLIKVLMLDNERIYNLGNVAEVCREVGIVRNSLKKVLLELNKLGLLNEVEEGIFGINIKFMSETLDIANYQELIDMRIEMFDKDLEIEKLRLEIVKLKREIRSLKKSNINMKESFNNSKKSINAKL